MVDSNKLHTMSTEETLKKNVYDLQEQLVVSSKKVMLLRETVETIGHLLSDCTVVNEMMEQYYGLQHEITAMENHSIEEHYKREDLKYNEELLAACITILKHYVPHSNLPEELK